MKLPDKILLAIFVISLILMVWTGIINFMVMLYANQ